MLFSRELENRSNDAHTHNKFKRKPFIRTKHDMRIFGVIPLPSYKTVLERLLNAEKRRQMRWRAIKTLICFGVNYVYPVLGLCLGKTNNVLFDLELTPLFPFGVLFL